jgi:hypothetical protein
MSRIDGTWRVERVSGALPPGLLRKRIFGDHGWTLAGEVPLGYFEVKRDNADSVTLDYRVMPVRDELEAREDGGWDGRGLLLGREICRFRLVRDGA